MKDACVWFPITPDMLIVMGILFMLVSLLGHYEEDYPLATIVTIFGFVMFLAGLVWVSPIIGYHNPSC